METAVLNANEEALLAVNILMSGVTFAELMEGGNHRDVGLEEEKQNDFEYFSVHSLEDNHQEEDISVVIKDQEYAIQVSETGQKINPKGSDGFTLTCKTCRSFRQIP